jgi:hypothetical protein
MEERQVSGVTLGTFENSPVFDSDDLNMLSYIARIHFLSFPGPEPPDPQGWLNKEKRAG